MCENCENFMHRKNYIETKDDTLYRNAFNTVTQ